MNDKFQKKLQTAATLLLNKCASDAVFFYKLEKVIDNKKTQTACTDGIKVFFNEGFLDKIPLNELVTLLAHEVRHVKFLHFSRLKNREPKIANIAMDHAINILLKKEGFFPIKNWYCDFKFINKTWEEIYAILNKNKKEEEELNDDFPIGSVIQPEISKEQLKELVERTIMETNQTEKAGKMAGNNSNSGMEKLLNASQIKQPDWEDQLREYFTNNFPIDYNYLSPDNFFYNTKFLFPNLDGESLENLNIYFDVSGSIDEKMFQYYLNIINNILNETNFQGNYNLFQFDTKILTKNENQSIEVGTIPKMINGEGTSYKCIGKQNSKTPTNLTIVLTDGICDEFPENIIDNTIWIIVSPLGIKKVPFGKLIEIFD